MWCKSELNIMICPGINMDKCVKVNIWKDKFRTNAEQIISLSWTNPKFSSPSWTLLLICRKLLFQLTIISLLGLQIPNNTLRTLNTKSEISLFQEYFKMEFALIITQSSSRLLPDYINTHKCTVNDIFI